MRNWVKCLNQAIFKQKNSIHKCVKSLIAKCRSQRWERTKGEKINWNICQVAPGIDDRAKTLAKHISLIKAKKSPLMIIDLKEHISCTGRKEEIREK